MADEERRCALILDVVAEARAFRAIADRLMRYGVASSHAQWLAQHAVTALRGGREAPFASEENETP